MKKLFNELMTLCNDETRFFYRDDVSPMGYKYRTFSYHYASYSDWLLPSALECRGIMFELDVDDIPVRIASRPMEKFFNLNETPFTMNLDLSKVKYMLAKEDGSLVSTYLDGENRIRFKSKTSIKSEQAVEASGMLASIEHLDLAEALIDLAKDGFTANFEYCSPQNRIVLSYPKKMLVLLNVRENDTGEYVDYEDLLAHPVLRKYLVEAFEVPKGDFVSKIRAEEQIEGYVMVMEDGLRFKLKTEWYTALHHTKDSIINNERLFECIVNNAADDLRGMFDSDEFALGKINAFETQYLNYLRSSLKLCQDFYATHRGKDRKSYAANAQAATAAAGLPQIFGIIMKMYAGDLDDDQLITKLNAAFLKNSKPFTPAKYI